ncbi:30S ribosomal protein S8e [Candidatus Hecatella orcuttiae]|jgi:small subunit ribosomal protein S8e|uniref:30S ribosomal protein S8e n=1 Tax=Candidatus Hecatella orcuttiae TaxID=1935119 RepID=UPI0028682F4C|nr:30S ribosomal protein S8e [Candidatus Hecatella orcuttiae]
MAWHSDLHKRKRTGGAKTPYRGRRKFERGGYPAETVVGEDLRVPKRGRGGNYKLRLRAAGKVQVSNPKTGKTQTAQILRVISNPSNVAYDRQGIITKGTILETEIGTAKVTSRPGQHGVLNAVLLKPKQA